LTCAVKSLRPMSCSPKKIKDGNMLKFNDGMEFDTTGELRIVKKSDGLYVVGKGMLIPIKSYQEGLKIIEENK